MIDSHLRQQISATRTLLSRKFNLRFEELPAFESFAEKALLHIMAAKLFAKRLAEPHVTDYTPFLEEIASSANQILVLASLGFRIAPYMMLRRSMENMMGYIYYREHPVEYYKREAMTEDAQFSGSRGLSEYAQNYPFDMLYPNLDMKQARKFGDLLVGRWKVIYKELSRYVHSQARKYLDTQPFIEDVNPSNDLLINLENQVEDVSSILGSLGILFFFNKYRSLKEEEKSVIRLSIKTGFGFKRELVLLFGEI